jgi:hypothetical protein
MAKKSNAPGHYLYKVPEVKLPSNKRLRTVIESLLDPQSKFGKLPSTIAAYIAGLESSKDVVARSIVHEFEAYCSM